MTTTTSRQNLALTACMDLTDDELQKRGAGAFKAMIERKRMYASKARELAAVAIKAQVMIAQRDQALAAAQAQIAELQAKYEALLNLDAPVENTDLAASLLAGLGKKGDAA